MGCLLALMSAFAPRLAFIFVWIARPQYVDATFDTWIWPLLGLVFLPFTTLIYLFIGPTGVEGFDWLWIALAVLLDLSQYANSYANRNVYSGMGSGGSLPPRGGPTMG